jgi:hypothetical protein
MRGRLSNQRRALALCPLEKKGEGFGRQMRV